MVRCVGCGSEHPDGVRAGRAAEADEAARSALARFEAKGVVPLVERARAFHAELPGARTTQ